jgi:hypothetical protein
MPVLVPPRISGDSFSAFSSSFWLTAEPPGGRVVGDPWKWHQSDAPEIRGSRGLASSGNRAPGLRHTVHWGGTENLRIGLRRIRSVCDSRNSSAHAYSQTGFAALNDFQRIESFSSGISITFSFTASPIHSRNSCFVPATATG